MENQKFWINTVSKEHVMLGKQNGFVQSGHGKPAPLKRLKKGDRIIFYSPKTSLENGEPLKSFTAIASIIDDKIYQVELSDDFKPYRINAQYEDCNEVKIEPLIENLSFIKNKKSWGYMFKFGLFKIDKRDFDLIYSKMKI
ncbi:MAG: EVE domain-containing protein [Candidatus Methanoperedens sp.]|nr:EVE domain-containing protein [Candidatus Methanoperedens sp.]MCZ7370178.1 EVE domain-containing protein [Candidatus Methanoperedens sp.]